MAACGVGNAEYWIDIMVKCKPTGIHHIEGMVKWKSTDIRHKDGMMNCKPIDKRRRWSRGNVLAFVTQVRGFKPCQSRRIFQSQNILSTPSFGGEVKPSVPCRRFTAYKRFLNAGETTSGESWNV